MCPGGRRGAEGMLPNTGVLAEGREGSKMLRAVNISRWREGKGREGEDR